ncbi:hypothetical protein HF673_18515 [Acidithiobacillus thiooxidans]|uniref:hypothetical protein n=1 Tax=Acidithiobacillus thiooxidans TaxID=930 RepID=UPI001C077909|nr:hypothetical protein [Acidithiobacillus thiooxidans]MBU2837674.1 hypothetical protein [Acidithiobacillus thiooxidans]
MTPPKADQVSVAAEMDSHLQDHFSGLRHFRLKERRPVLLTDAGSYRHQCLSADGKSDRPAADRTSNPLMGLSSPDSSPWRYDRRKSRSRSSDSRQWARDDPRPAG